MLNENERLGTNRECTSESINHVPRNSRYKPSTHVTSAKKSKLRIFQIKKLRIFRKLSIISPINFFSGFGILENELFLTK